MLLLVQLQPNPFPNYICGHKHTVRYLQAKLCLKTAVGLSNHLYHLLEKTLDHHHSVPPTRIHKSQDHTPHQGALFANRIGRNCHRESKASSYLLHSSRDERMLGQEQDAEDFDMHVALSPECNQPSLKPEPEEKK